MWMMVVRQSGEAGGDGPARRVLLAEDDEEMRTLLAACLEQRGYAVEEIADGTALLNTFDALRTGTASAPPDLVVTDVQMPGCNGLGAVAVLRQWNESLPVVIITAFGDERLHQRAAELGVARVLDKPFDLTEFLGAVDTAAG